MRNIIKFNTKWAFTKHAKTIPQTLPKDWIWVNLPHTWNNIDGQDGENDYYRGTCFYAKRINKADLPNFDKYYLEIQGANSSADVFINGKKIAHHDGGYSTWRVDMTKHIENESLLVLAVDNSANNHVYPQMADFTFYGGLYRDVNIICVNESHFELDYYGASGLKVTPIVNGNNAQVTIEAFVTNYKNGQSLIYTVYDSQKNEVFKTQTTETKVHFEINNVHLWHGKVDPYLYTARIDLVENENLIDNVQTRFGCRSFFVDSERGFILNGEEYPLRGVSRHQDRWEYGNALFNKHHEQDMDLICELGANTVRLAHYQHDKYFYDLCDEKGMIVWAEIPYISQHMNTANENTISQMTELIVQNYNHPSIAVWGLSNEITMKNENDPDLIDNHRRLNNLCHELDKTRLTAIAVVSPCPIDSEYLKIPDLVSYNHYFGWYGGDALMNGPWFDKFHKENPDIPIGCSEYGCEALDWHTSNPVQGDYTEEYQAYYHQELIKQLFTRKYIWSTYVWNMFDFGADARMEGGENGQNHKGLVTFDRKYKKDSFYAYKAWLSDEPFVHICSKRYVDRVEDTVKITVYSNLPEVELFANDISLGKKTATNHFFIFDVPNNGLTQLKAVAKKCEDHSAIRKVEKFNEKYTLKEKGAVLNWFDVTEVEGFFSLNDKLIDIMATEDGMKIFKSLFNKKSNKDVSVAGFEINENMMKMLGSFTLLRLIGMLGTMGIKLSKQEVLDINEKLNKVKKR